MRSSGIREKSIDVMKGILILMVVWGHIVFYVGLYSGIALKTSPFVYTAFISNNFIAPYYMAAFFWVTGYCSSYRRRFRDQVVIDFRRLVVPAVIIPVLMSFFFSPPLESFQRTLINTLHLKLPWFLLACFLSKNMLYAFRGVKLRWLKLTIQLLLSFLGCYLLEKYKEYNYICLFHAMAFVPFVAIGHEMRNLEIKDKWIIPSVMIYGVIIIAFILSKRVVPSLCGIITFPAYLYPVYVVLAILGTIIWFIISRKIGSSLVLEYLGRNSLVIYLTHFSFFSVATYILKSFILENSDRFFPSLFIVMFMFIGATVWSCAWINVLNTKYLKWIIGK